MKIKHDNIIIRIDKKLHKFFIKYCEDNFTSMTEVLTRYIHSLYKEENKNDNLQNDKSD
jgi:hypothetical protein